jgi:hypothetical protein
MIIVEQLSRLWHLWGKNMAKHLVVLVTRLIHDDLNF